MSNVPRFETIETIQIRINALGLANELEQTRYTAPMRDKDIVTGIDIRVSRDHSRNQRLYAI